MRSVFFSEKYKRKLVTRPAFVLLCPRRERAASTTYSTTAMKKIEVTGSTTIGNILSEYGKILDTGKVNSITLEIQVASNLEKVKKSAVVSRADTDAALDKLSTEEIAIVKKFQQLEKTFAAARVAGQESDRWKSSIVITA